MQAPVQVDGPQRPGHRRLDRADVAHHDHVAVGSPGPGAVDGEQLLAGGGDAPVHLGQGLAALGAEVPVALPPLPHLGRDAAERLALELAVVDLDPALVHHDGRAQGEQLGRVEGAAERARAHLGHRVVHQGTGRLGLGATRVGQLGVGPAEQQALRVGHRLTVAHQDQHDQVGTRMRPHCSQVATSPGGRARIFSTSTEDSSRWQPSQWLPTRRAAPVPLRRARRVS